MMQGITDIHQEFVVVLHYELSDLNAEMRG